MEKEFIRTRSVLDILVSLAFVSLGTILTFYPLGKMSGAIGIVCLIVGFLSLLLLKTTYKDEMGEKGYIKKTFCFPNDMKEDILAAMRNGSIENIGNIHFGVHLAVNTALRILPQEVRQGIPASV